MTEQEFIQIILEGVERRKHQYNRPHRRNGHDLVLVRWDRQIKRINHKLKAFRKW